MVFLQTVLTSQICEFDESKQSKSRLGKRLLVQIQPNLYTEVSQPIPNRSQPTPVHLQTDTTSIFSALLRNIKGKTDYCLRSSKQLEATSGQ
jgi:hypothetical protein